MGKAVKHLFVTRGVVSSPGKGITAASVALLLKQRGYPVFLQKLTEQTVSMNGLDTVLNLAIFTEINRLEQA